MKTLKYALKHEWYNVILLVLPFIAIPFLWSHLPDQVPMHWNFQGQVDDYASKPVGLLFSPVLNVGLYLLNLYLPKIDPKNRITIGQKPIPVIRTLLVFFIFAVYCWMLSIALDVGSPSPSWIQIGLAILFIVMGNYMRTIQPNYFIGIRVPWALEDPENWRKTHRLGGYIWMAGGFLLILLFPLFGNQTYSILSMIVIGILVFVPMGYSFYLYKSKS